MTRVVILLLGKDRMPSSEICMTCLASRGNATRLCLVRVDTRLVTRLISGQ